MPDSTNAGSTGRERPAGDSGGRADPGHARARDISEARNTAKARGSSRAPREKELAHPDTGTDRQPDSEPDPERLRRRAHFLRERNEAQELRDRVQPRRTRSARRRQSLRMRTFRR